MPKQRKRGARQLSNDPGWVLGEVSLSHCQPLSIKGLADRLRKYERCFNAFQLLDEHFPVAVAEYEARLATVRGDFSLDQEDYDREPKKVGWWQVLAHFFNLVERDLFPINWNVVSEAGACWADPQYSDKGELLATYITYIPLLLYGLGEKTVQNYPPMEVMHVLLSQCKVEAVSANLLVEAGIYDSLDSWTAKDKASAWQFLQLIETSPSAWPESIRTLPTLARYACHATRNIVLDSTFNPYSQEGPWLTWNNHTIHVQSSWNRARITLKWFDRLMKWYMEEPGRLAYLAQFIMEAAKIEQKLGPASAASDNGKRIQIHTSLLGGFYDELNW